MDFNQENDHTWTIGRRSYITDVEKSVSETLKKPFGNKNNPTVK